MRGLASPLTVRVPKDMRALRHHTHVRFAKSLEFDSLTILENSKILSETRDTAAGSGGQSYRFAGRFEYGGPGSGNEVLGNLLFARAKQPNQGCVKKNRFAPKIYLSGNVSAVPSCALNIAYL